MRVTFCQAFYTGGIETGEPDGLTDENFIIKTMTKKCHQGIVPAILRDGQHANTCILTAYRLYVF